MGFTNSQLVNFTQISPNKSVPRALAIDRVTIHCYVGQTSVENMGAWFVQTSAKCSSNYGIGSDGRVGLFVQERDRSWCSSSSENDNRAVTIECASDTKHPYAINDKVYATLLDLVTDICKRNGKTVLLWFGDKTRTLSYQPAPNEMVMTVHRWFANKACPGDYIYSRLSTIANEVTKRLGGKVAPMYRVRLSWDKPETQLEADYELDNAKACADAHPGFSVYDEDGKCVYTSKSDGVPVEGEYTPEQWISLLAPDAVEVCKKNELLPSVMLAQACLETGFGKTDLAKKHNIFGMKCDLINGTWKDWSTWDGVSIHEKYSPEEENGKVVQRKSKFRVYNTFKQCMEDYAGFLLHVRNDKGYKYACIKGWTDPAKVIHRIRIGTGTDAHPEGYCTDSGYEYKILNLINKYDLTKYDKEAVPEPQPEPEPSTDKKKVYRVRVGIYKQAGYMNNLIKKIKDKLDLDCFTEKHDDGTHVYCGSFSSEDSAKEREKLLKDAKFKTEIEVAEV